MNIDHFSTFTYGGAGVAARRIHDGLLQEGVSSRFIHRASQENEVDDPSCIPFEVLANWDIPLLNPLLTEYRRRQTRMARKMYRRHLANRNESAEVFSTPRNFHATHFDFARHQCDIIHLHWVAFYIDYASFFASIPNDVPVVWTLHDMNPFTGGCHYTQGCEKFKQGCGNCPQIVNGDARDASFDGYRLKKMLFKRKRLHIVTPSRWLGEMAQQSQIFPSSTTFDVIPYGLDTQEFSPIDKRLARQQLGLPQDGTFVGFGAEAIDTPRKGFHLLRQAFQALAHGVDSSGAHSKNATQLQGIVFGRGKFSQEDFGRFPLHQVGFIDNQARRRLVYSAMDMFVMPSLEDNQPQTGLEAMACGTPVIGFDTSGVPEVITEGKTGFVIPAFETDRLARQIDWLSQRRDLMQEMAQSARADILHRFESQRQAQDYVDFYHRILQDLKTTPALSKSLFKKQQTQSDSIETIETTETTETTETMER